MNINEAVVKRILEICKEKQKTICDISLRAGMSPSNIYALRRQRTQNLKINTIQRFCEGAQISLSYFFTSDLFDNLDLED